MGAAPRGSPGWPLLAFWIASMARVRMEFTHIRSRVDEEDAAGMSGLMKTLQGLTGKPQEPAKSQM